MAIGKLSEVVIDCHDCDLLAEFWANVLGGTPVRESVEWVAVMMADGSTTVSFQQVPEDKTGKNRVHLDVLVDDLEQAAARCVELGATRIGGRQGDPLGDFIVLADPEGNEFCVVTN
jgi:predicted enzyme related to lactoylglutathione lyase